eukprot:CAMPEP_0206445332 /NCGR_PEP_ID=MMETSP0324_2-20121206/15445_1 /ASSEMBLY_ACC=CAM_ASM_000836 /TAXON_ID=2866 /ORGANISM="Crypthecodinium cohnii, Strain Seligo" /LENGTH=288 /DNA_ID=CAMNT_0053913527 /DNA_START=89 /DNA_END=955 /DNA_ORIENTATION=+
MYPGQAPKPPPLALRPPDVMTYAHARAAEMTHDVARWVLRGGDFIQVRKNIPYLVEDATQLWQYYEELHLFRRFELPLLLAGSSICLNSYGMVTRQKHPLFFRILDIYTGVVTCFAIWPKQLFYWVHRFNWNMATREAYGRTREPQMPLLFSAENRASISAAASRLVSVIENALVGSSSSASSALRSRSEDGNSGASFVSFRLTAGISLLGLGAYLYTLTNDERQQFVETVFKQSMAAIEWLIETSGVRQLLDQKPKQDPQNPEPDMQALQAWQQPPQHPPTAPPPQL